MVTVMQCVGVTACLQGSISLVYLLPLKFSLSELDRALHTNVTKMN